MVRGISIIRSMSMAAVLAVTTAAQANEVSGGIFGAIAGGILGHAIDNGRTFGTVAGVIIGSEVGASIGRSAGYDSHPYRYRQSYPLGHRSGYAPYGAYYSTPTYYSFGISAYRSRHDTWGGFARSDGYPRRFHGYAPQTQREFTRDRATVPVVGALATADLSRRNIPGVVANSSSPSEFLHGYTRGPSQSIYITPYGYPVR